MEHIDILKTGAEKFNIKLTNNQIERFIKYRNMLIEWNKKINLTTIVDDKEIIIKHFLDSLSCFCTELIDSKCKIIDIGTGAGFPSIPIKIIRPDISMVLVDSLNKRIKFLNNLKENLNLSNIELIHSRAEQLGKDKKHREAYNICVSRAVANLAVLSEYCLPFVKVGGYFISMKGTNVDDEITQSKNAVKILGGKIVEKKIISLPSSNISHSLIIIKKIKNCSNKYPRNPGKPSKEPLR